MITTIIFDMDGVIIDSQQVANALLIHMLQTLGVPATQEDIDNLQGTGHEEFWKYIVDKYKLPESPEHYANDDSLYDEEEEIRLYKDLDPIPGVVELLRILKDKGFKLAVATSASHTRMHAVLSLFDIAELFDVTVCVDDVTQSKPNPEVFLTTAKKLAVPPEECIVIEDSKNGVLAAKSANMKCIGYVNKNSGTQDLSRADLIVESFWKLDEKILAMSA